MSEAEQKPATSDPVGVLWRGFCDVIEGRMPREQFLRAAADPALAAAATPASAEGIAAWIRHAISVRQSEPKPSRFIAWLEGVFQRLGSLPRPEDTPLLLAQAVEKHAIALSEQGRSELAVTLYQAAGPLVENYGSREQLANFRYREAFSWMGCERTEEALSCFDRAIAIFSVLYGGERPVISDALPSALLNKGTLLGRLMRLPEAVAACDQSIALYRQLIQEGHPEHAGGLGAALANKAGTLRRLGRLAEALAAAEEACQLLAQCQGRGRELAAAVGTKGNVLADLGRSKESAAALGLAVKVAEEPTGQADGRGEALALHLTNRANALATLGQFEDAFAHYDRALEIRRGLASQSAAEAIDLAVTLANKADLHIRQQQPVDALADLDEAAVLCRDLVARGHREAGPILAAILANQARGLRDLGALPAALRILESEVSAETFSGDRRRLHHALLAELLWSQDRREEALHQLTLGRAILRDARRAAGVNETALDYVAQRESFVDQCVHCWLESGLPAEAFDAVQGGKAVLFGDTHGRSGGDDPPSVLDARRALTEVLRRSGPRSWLIAGDSYGALVVPHVERNERIGDYLRAWGRAHASEVSPSIPPEEASLSAIQAALPPAWAILDFWRLGDTLHTFAVTADGLTAHQSPFPLDELADGLEHLVRALSGPPSGDLPALATLHAHLFAPLLPWLRERKVTGLYLVPHGFLHALPLHAARSPEGAYVCDEFDVAYLPSSALLPRLPAPRREGPMFSMSNPERDTPHSLPFADWEGEQIEQRFRSRGGVFLRGPEATFPRTAEWGGAAVIHFSGHGVGDASFAPFSHLRLADDLLLAHDVVHRRPALREGAVVILNGCETSVRDARAFNEGMGLMTGFLLRGASFVLATQWSVEDRSAAEFVLAFLDQLLEHDASPTQAMRSAQRTVRRLPVDESSGRANVQRNMQAIGARPRQAASEVSPLLWGAFQLVGRVV